MRRLLILSIAFLSICLASNARAVTDQQLETNGKPAYALEDFLPVDPGIVTGVLDNGLTYYIRKNGTPEKRVELRLIVNVGSVLEDDDQVGLAHFVEHMAFNGTKHFRKGELVDYLESIGMRFGPDINARTGFDETVYKLELPSENSETIETGLQILEDWAHGIEFDGGEIDKERGVIIEEWRLRRCADARIQDEQLQVLFQGSKYANRLPIGEKTLLETFDPDALRRFYKDWYRPDLMAVVAVGDLDVDRVEKLIRDHFGRIPKRENPRERKLFRIPEHQKTLFAIASDPEATESRLSITFQLPAQHEPTGKDYRENLVEQLYLSMLTQRLLDLSRQEASPFLTANAEKSRLVRTHEFYTLSAIVRENDPLRGIEALLTEARRVQQYGFVSHELVREKKSILRSMEQAYKELGKTDSSQLTSELVRSFLTGEPIPGIENEYGLYKQFIPGISLAEVNAVAGRWLAKTNPVITLAAPRKDGIRIPTEDQMIAMIDSVGSESHRSACGRFSGRTPGEVHAKSFAGGRQGVHREARYLQMDSSERREGHIENDRFQE